MSLRNQPYLPLYVQDFMTDEKLVECSAESTGVYIRLMCILHKSDTYGAILLKQKDKQNDKQIKNFANKLAKQLPYDFEIIERSLEELINENVLTLDGDMLYQKRMVKDGELSEKRAVAGKRGAKVKEQNDKQIKNFANDFAIANLLAKPQANSENEIDNNSNNKINIINTLNESNRGMGEEETNLISYYENNIGTISDIICEKLNEYEKYYGNLKVTKAIEIATMNNKKNLKYIEGILLNWGDKSWKEIQDEEKKSKSKEKYELTEEERKISDYDWISEPIEKMKEIRN